MKESRSCLEKILSTIIVLLVLSLILPSSSGVLNRVKKCADVLTARNIYEVITIGFTMDSLEAPNKEMYIVVEDAEDITSSLDREYRRIILNYLKENMDIPEGTKLDKKKFIIKVEPNCDVEILVGSNLGDGIYPEATGIYQ